VGFLAPLGKTLVLRDVDWSTLDITGGHLHVRSSFTRAVFIDQAWVPLSGAPQSWRGRQVFANNVVDLIGVEFASVGGTAIDVVASGYLLTQP
jgi:hypothetical protein